MSLPTIRATDPTFTSVEDHAITQPHHIRPHLGKRTFSADPSPPATKTPAATGNNTLTPHTLTLQANGNLVFEHVSRTHLTPYALGTGVSADKTVSDRPLSKDQQEGIFNVRSSKNDAIPGHQVEATRRYLVRWHSFPVLENWSKALTQPGYPPLKVIADAKPGTWTVEPNTLLTAMAESLYAHRGKPLAGVLDPKTQLFTEGKARYVHIHGRNFPVEEHKIKPPLAIANSQQKGISNGLQRIAKQPPINGFFIKTPPGLSASDWPSLPIEYNGTTGEWSPVFTPAHITTLLTLLAETGLYGFTKQKHGKVQNFQFGNHYAPIANNIIAKIGSLSLPAVIHHGGRLPAVPVKWDPLHHRYYIYSDPQAAVSHDFTEREAWGIRLLMVGHLLRNPIQGATDLIKAMQNDPQAQERLSAFIQTGQWTEDNSIGGISAQGGDMAFNIAYSVASDRGSVGVNVASWALTLLGKALLNQPVTKEDAEEILAAGADIIDLGLDHVAHKTFKKITVAASNTPQLSPATASPQKKRVDSPLLRWAEAKAVDEPHLQQDSHYANLWRHNETGKLYVLQQQHFPRYLPVVKRADSSFVAEPHGTKKTEKYLTAGQDGQLHTMTSAQQSAWLNKHPSQLELQQRHYREIEVTARDGSKSIGYVAINNETIKTVYRFVPESRSFTQSGQSVDAEGRVIGLSGGAPAKRPASAVSGAPAAKNPKADLLPEQQAWLDANRLDPNEQGKVSAREVAVQYVDHKAAANWTGITQLQIASYYQVNPSTLRGEITREQAARVPPNAQQAAWLKGNELKGKRGMEEVARLYITNKRKPDWPGITTAQLANYYQLSPNTLRTSIFRQEAAKKLLDPTQAIWLKQHGITPNAEGKVKTEDVARQYVTMKGTPDWPNISQAQMAKYYGVNQNSLCHKIAKLEALNQQLKPEQQAWLDANPLQLNQQGKVQVGVEKVAKLYVDHKNTPGWPNISRHQMAEYYKVNPDTLLSEIKWEQEARKPLKPEQKLWIEQHLLERDGKGKGRSWDIAKQYIEHKDTAEWPGITEAQLARYYKVKASTLHIAVNRQLSAQKQLTPEQEIWIKQHSLQPNQSGNIPSEEVAKLYLKHRNSADWPGLTQSQMAEHYQINLHTLLSAITTQQRKQNSPTLTPTPTPPTVIKIEADSQPYTKGPVKLITFTDSGDEIDIHNPTPSRLDDIPIVDNNLPILRDPQDFTHSLTLSAEGKTHASELDVSNWGALGVLFQDIRSAKAASKARKDLALRPAKSVKQIKTELKQELQRQIENETRLGKELESRMVSLPSHREDSEGNIINLGTGVFNPQNGSDVEPFTVLGPYAGVFLDSKAAHSYTDRHIGSIRNISHSWGTKATSRSVNGWESGNILRNINTDRLGDAPAVGVPNVTLVRVGKNIAFYVTTKKVKPGEEYLISYGPGYNAHFSIDNARKEERLAQLWYDHRAEIEEQNITLQHIASRSAVSAKYLGKSVLHLRQQNSSGQALAFAAEDWLNKHKLPDAANPENKYRATQVANFYLDHQAEAESWGIMPTRLAEFYNIPVQNLDNRVAQPLKSRKLPPLTAEAKQWLDNKLENKVAPNGINIKKEPPEVSPESGLSWLAENINTPTAWINNAFEAMPTLIARSNTLRQIDAFLVITNSNNGISQVLDSRTGNTVNPAIALQANRPLLVVRQQHNHYDAWLNHQHNVTFLPPDMQHGYYRVNAAANQLLPIGKTGYCMTEAVAAGLLSREGGSLAVGNIQEYGKNLRNDISALIPTLSQAEQQSILAVT
ncbi:SET domain-containing protein [Rahnella sp. SAP-1]|uniref:SET domain-containing protein n=1 Tax=Rouxiella aceris TaxID=2703884 RepID=A0A848MHS8_9GAMM|nr:hypothetical protein [Rouxiella aceris]NMP26723.1 SET domain-containing protein [Rouxiella aceris]